MLKDFQVDLELSPRDNRVIQTGATYWSHDVNTAKIVVNLKRNSEPIILSSTVSVRMIMVFDDNDTQKKQVHKMTIDDTRNGVVSLVLPKETLGFVGNVLCGVYVNYGENQSTDNGYFTFSMRRSLIDGEFPQLENGYVSEFQTMLDYMIETASEFDNVEEELNKRIDVIEKDIASNEIAKQKDVSSIVRENIIKDSLNDFVIKPRDTGQSSDNFNYQRFDYETDGSFDYTFSSEVEVTHGSIDFVTVRFTSPIVDYNVPIVDGKITATHKADGNARNSVFVYAGKQGETRGKGMVIKKAKLEKNNQKTTYKPHITEIATKNDTKSLQKQIDELKNAITTLGGTL